jgi:ankyrin repeat protein
MGDIFRATEEGNEEEVIRLLDADPTLLEREHNEGNRPLLWAACYGQLGVTRLLIARGANINATGVLGGTALHSAAGGGYYDIVTLLLREGAHANTRKDNGTTPLMLAGLKRRLDVMKLLLQHIGAQGLEDRDAEHGWTALHYAGWWGREEMAKFLLFAGADPTITDNRGRTPRALAEEEHRSSVMNKGRPRCVAVFQVRPLTC